MTLEKLANWRIERLQAFVDLKFEGNKAALGRALGYKDGAFVGQMLRGERPITEKTVDQIQALAGGRGWFNKEPSNALALSPAAHQELATFSVITLDAAVERVAQHLETVEGYDLGTTISLFTTLANDPSMHSIVAAGLKALKPLKGHEHAKQSSPAQEHGRHKAA